LLENLRWNPAGRAVVLEPLHHLAFGRQEHLEQFAQFLGRHLLLAGVMERLAMLGGLVTVGQELLAGGRRLLWRAKTGSRHAR
jgi:hypothetical protein